MRSCTRRCVAARARGCFAAGATAQAGGTSSRPRAARDCVPSGGSVPRCSACCSELTPARTRPRCYTLRIRTRESSERLRSRSASSGASARSMRVS